MYTVHPAHYDQLAEQLGERYREWLARSATNTTLLNASSTEDAVNRFCNWAKLEYQADITYDYEGDCIAAITLPSTEAAVKLYLLI